MLVVADSSPLHYLVLIEAIEVLPALYSRVIAPPAVMEELSHPRTPHAVRVWIAQPPAWLEYLSNETHEGSQVLRQAPSC